jgi:hypothetical protein
LADDASLRQPSQPATVAQLYKKDVTGPARTTEIGHITVLTFGSHYITGMWPSVKEFVSFGDAIGTAENPHVRREKICISSHPPNCLAVKWPWGIFRPKTDDAKGCLTTGHNRHGPDEGRRLSCLNGFAVSY